VGGLYKAILSLYGISHQNAKSNITEAFSFFLVELILSNCVIVPANLSSNVLDRIFNQTQAICVQANNRTRGKVLRRFGAQEVQDQGEEEQPQIVQLSFKKFPNNFKQLFAFPHKFCQCLRMTCANIF
jgi:hypothetical protein